MRARPIEPVPAPPDPPPTSTVAITSVIVPLASGVGFALLFGRPQFLLLALLAPVALVSVARFERRRGRRSHRSATADHVAVVDAAIDTVHRGLAAERAERQAAHPSVDDLLAGVAARDARVWCRDRRAPDCLELRVGTTDAASQVSTTVAPGGSAAERAAVAARLAAAAATVSDVPAVVDLDRLGVVAIHGDPATVTGLTASVLGQVAVLHSPDDVVIAAMVPPAALVSMAWLRFLPHTQAASSPLASPALVTWPDSIAAQLAELSELVAVRTAASWPRIVLVVHEDAPVDRAGLGRLLERAPAAGIRVLWVGSTTELVPRQCRATIDARPGDRACVLTAVDPDVDPVRFTAETVDPGRHGALDAACRSLEPLRDATSTARRASIARVVGLADVVWAADADDIATRWARSTGASLAAPIGVGADGPLWIDIVEDGPHMLVAGTSGAGKSELLQAMVASLAAHHPPQRLTFLFVDYKGGAAAAPFATLPHNVGSVSNLDPRLSRRALVSLRAELDRRMRLVADVGGKDITDLDGGVETVPRLVIVVDEFATLVKEIPDFVAGIVDIAQRGRSLGIHLVLATQRPAGAVNDNILANTNLRICLRVLDAADSQSVIGTPDAAEIPPPLRGRGFARVGPGDLVPFQSAWSGAPCRPARRPGAVTEPLAFETRAPVASNGDGAVGGHDGRGSDDESGQLDVVLSDIAGAPYGPRPRRPWVPPLPAVVGLDTLAPAPDDGADPGRWIRIGRRDEPARQRHRTAAIDLEAQGGLVVFGTGGSGRSTVLRTAIASVADTLVVGFDFASRALVPLLDLACTRSVSTPDDLDGVARSIDWLAEQVTIRRRYLGDARAESLGALRARPDAPPPADLPRILVVIDGYGALRAELDKPAGYDWLQRLGRVLVEGRQVGIHPLIAADRRADLPNPVLGAIAARLVLRMADVDAMIALGVPAAIARDGDLPPGRGLLDGDGEVQVAVLGDDPSGLAQSQALAALGRGSTAGLRASRPHPLPAVVSAASAPGAFGVDEDGGHHGLDPARGHLLIVGPPGSGRTTALTAVMRSVDGPRHRPETAADLDAVVAGTVALDDVDRHDDPTFAAAVERAARRVGVRLVVTADHATVARAFGGWVAAVKRSRYVLVLQPADAAEIDQAAGVRARLRPGVAFPPGRGVLVAGRTSTIVQIVS